MKHKQLPLVVLAYCLPFLLFEALAQVIYAERLENGTAITSLLKIDTNRAYGLKPANQDKVLTHQDLYDWNSKPQIKTTHFRTDRHGTILPSSLQAATSGKRAYVLFCGGSTTEGSFIKEGYRLPDVYSRYSGLQAVNAGKSGKDLSGCINTISHFLERGHQPHAIIIANNVNTLMTFADKTGKKPTQALSPLSLLRRALPGSYQLIKDMRQQFKHTQGNNSEHQRALAYERALDSGCCHGAAQVNRSRPELDWTLATTQKQYERYVKAISNELDRVRQAHQVNKSRIFFLIEPNSFALPGTSGKRDWRQRLHSFNGRQLSLQESAAITATYDRIYSESLASKGYKIISIPQSLLGSEDFYDAVHLTPTGSEKMGRFYSEKIQPASIQKPRNQP